MPDFEQHGWQGFWIPGRRVSGRHGLAVIIKRRFEVDLSDGLCKPVPTAPVALMAEDHDDAEPPSVSVRHPGEIAVEKPLCDVIVRGTAYAPQGKPVQEFTAEVRVSGVLHRRLRIVGDRHLIWYPPVKWLSREDLAKGEQWIWPDPDFSEPSPIDKVPLRYEYAYGGWAKVVLTEVEQEMAAEAQEIGKAVEKKRERKKEIEKELMAAEEAKNKPPEPKKAPTSVKDEKAAALAAKAFGDARGDQKLDAATEKALAEAEAADDGMVIVSRFKHEQELAEVEAQAPATTAAKSSSEGEPSSDSSPDVASDARFTSDKTGFLDLNALSEGRDELRELLSERATQERRELMDDEGALKDSATAFGDIQLHDDSWSDGLGGLQKPKEKKKVDLTQPVMPYPANMAGRGFCVSHLEEAVENLPLPNIEDPDDPLTPESIVMDLVTFDLKKLRTPAGWAAYPMAWYPRAGHFGCYFWDVEQAKEVMEKVKADYDEDDPDDKVVLEQLKKLDIPLMDPRAFQEAHPGMQVKELRGDEEIWLTHLTPEGQLYFRLPGVHPTVTLDMSRGPELLKMRLDTLLIDVEDPAKPAVELVWRAWYPLRDFNELEVKVFKKINIIETDQEGWIAQKAKEVARKTDDGAAVLMPDDEPPDDLFGDAADDAYRAQFRKQRGGFGVRLDEDADAAVFDQTEGRQQTTDVWDEQLRAEREAFIAQQRRLEELRKSGKLKELRAAARDRADEEAGIIRDPETGEVLAVEKPEQGGKKK
jgi:hypothetical protein